MEIEVPGRPETDVVVAVVVPVVDVETLGIEVADVDAVTVRVEILLVPIRVTENRGLLPLQVYILPSLNFIWEQFFQTPPQEMSKKFSLSLIALCRNPWTTSTLAISQGEISRELEP